MSRQRKRAPAPRGAHAGRTGRKPSLRAAIGLCALAAMATLAATGMVPTWLALVVGAVNLATFALYGHDKAAARRQAWRVSEATLHGCALAGGWPAALVAQQWFAHKTGKQPFQWRFLATVLANIGLCALAWRLLYGGIPALR